MSQRLAMALALLVACGTTKPPPVLHDISTTGADTEDERRDRKLAELKDDILSSYERDEPPDFETAMIGGDVGGARIGVGPDDVLYDRKGAARAPGRWPLDIDRDLTDIRSKHLEIHLAGKRGDVPAAWMSDELSWRITTCGRTAVIPLRMTALYAHDGDRWVVVFEHMSFAPPPSPEGQPLGKTVPSAIVNHWTDLADSLSRVVDPVLTHQVTAADSIPADALLIGPKLEDEWRGPVQIAAGHVVESRLIDEDRRIGTIGRTPGKSTIAYWVGTFVTDQPTRPGEPPARVRLRGTFVFESRPIDGKSSCPGDNCRWQLVQGHVSTPIGDYDLAKKVFGAALISDTPLRVRCDKVSATPAQGQSTAPEVAP